ncbi:hypothetical protein C8R44DRAFT_905683 [Mycena epipterygia]|nr:hypothetical protein C8R44DRAFT_905683 [Mycena epipterygia]
MYSPWPAEPPVYDSAVTQYRSKSRPFIDVDDGRRDLWTTIISRCIRAKRSRLYKPVNHPGAPLELEYITVTGLHGLKLRISDFYSAMGLVITDTDPYPYQSDPTKRVETTDEKDELHMRMLATYSKWITIAARNHFNDPGDAIPSTACVMYVKTPSSVRPVLSMSADEVPQVSTQSPGPYYAAAVFPNLSGALKNLALQLQQQNLQGFKKELEFLGISPQELAGFDDWHFGHCSEILALL